jgi:hypothetical protein
MGTFFQGHDILSCAKVGYLGTGTALHLCHIWDFGKEDFEAWARISAARYRIALEQRPCAPSTINLRLAAIRRLAYEASDWVSSSWMHAFRHGCNRRWELAGMNSAVLRQQMGYSSAVMTTRFTGEIPVDKVQEAFSKMELENMEIIGKRPRCAGSRLVVYNQ